MYDQQITFFHLFDLVESNGFYIIEDIHSSEEDNYDLLNDKSNSTKKIFENIKNGDFFKSIYINNENKCNEISSQISDIKLFKIKEGSEVIFIYKK
jgi:hypothetical protein